MLISISIETSKQNEVQEAYDYIKTLMSKPEVETEKVTGEPETGKKPTKEPKEVSEPSKETKQPESDSEITLADLQAEAKAASKRETADAVRAVLKRYGGKIADVTPNNYEALMNELKNI